MSFGERLSELKALMATKNERQPEFTRNDSLEGLLDEINVRLAAGEPDLKDKYPSPSLPVLMVIGPPRSGTTVTMQWLANSGYFAYPTNLLSRFYGAPYVGALIQQLIFDPRFNYKNELFDHNGDSGTAFRSDLGKTKGPTQPNEFWYFWRRFVDIDQAEKLSQQQIDSFDRSGFLAGLANGAGGLSHGGRIEPDRSGWWLAGRRHPSGAGVQCH